MHIRTWQFWIIFVACLHSFGEVFCVMGKKHRCWVGGSNNDQRYPYLVVKRSHVSELIWHQWPKGEPYESFWENAYRKGTKISSQVHAWLYVRTTSWKWTESDQHTFSPRKRRKLDRSTTESASIIPPDVVLEDHTETSEDCIYPWFKLAQTTVDSDDRFVTDIPSTETFKFLFG